MMEPIQMVDLKSQYLRIKDEMDAAMRHVLDSTAFIQGAQVHEFENQLAQYTGSKHVISCGNGTDALTAALMALEIGQGDEVITPAFTFIATAEAVALTGATPVFVDVCEETFTIDVSKLESTVTPRTKAIIPVHLFGQCADMEPLLEIAEKHNISVIEDACQAISTTYTFSDGTVKQAGTMGKVGCLSFFPSKNLGCYGDGGAMMTQDETLASKLRAICKHGSVEKYNHQMVGMNSRLDTLQATILQVKLHYLDEYLQHRKTAAAHYYESLKNIEWILLPERKDYSSHTFHQFTLRITNGKRDALKQYLEGKNIPSMIYYPIPTHLQPAYRTLGFQEGDFPISEQLCKEVLSLPMHTELTEEQLEYICQTIKDFPL